MARIRKSAAPPMPPARSTARPTVPPEPPKPITTLPSELRAHARFADSHFGNRDGVLDRAELAKYAAAYASQPGFQEKVFQPLGKALGERSDVEPATTPGPAANQSLAAKLTVAGGSADQTDVELVAAQLATLPAGALKKMQAAHLKVIAARGSVTDVCTELKGVQPRGWPPGATWDQVPGLYDPSRKAVIIATVETEGGGRAVPPKGQLHGAYSLVLHETGHGLDFRKALDKKGSNNSPFQTAYQADRASLESNGETYLLQPGAAGQEEAYAESFARYFAGDPQLAKVMPNLQGYWQEVAGKLGGKP
ncbi:MAG TPA: hypothetical protein VGK67_10470 [Myxococcales bacterium]|jgi:hypothetical protein